MTIPMRVPNEVHRECKHVAALRGQQPADLLAEAWREYMANHREEFAAELEETARLLRGGTLDDVAAFASRNAKEQAAAAAAAARDGRSGTQPSPRQVNAAV